MCCATRIVDFGTINGDGKFTNENVHPRGMEKAGGMAANRNWRRSIKVWEYGNEIAPLCYLLDDLEVHSSRPSKRRPTERRTIYTVSKDPSLVTMTQVRYHLFFIIADASLNPGVDLQVEHPLRGAPKIVQRRKMACLVKNGSCFNILGIF
jgi:hypothetical protein